MIHKDHICTALRVNIEHMIGESWSRCFGELDTRSQNKIVTEAIEDAEEKAETYGQALMFAFRNLCEDGAVSISGEYYDDIFTSFVEEG